MVWLIIFGVVLIIFLAWALRPCQVKQREDSELPPMSKWPLDTEYMSQPPEKLK
jgi:hypothetical protein